MQAIWKHLDGYRHNSILLPIVALLPCLARVVIVCLHCEPDALRLYQVFGRLHTHLARIRPRVLYSARQHTPPRRFNSQLQQCQLLIYHLLYDAIWVSHTVFLAHVVVKAMLVPFWWWTKALERAFSIGIVGTVILSASCSHWRVVCRQYF